MDVAQEHSAEKVPQDSTLASIGNNRARAPHSNASLRTLTTQHQLTKVKL